MWVKVLNYFLVDVLKVSDYFVIFFLLYYDDDESMCLEREIFK